MRCIICNEILFYGELRKKKPDGTAEDTCTRCLQAAFHPQYSEDKVLSILTDWDILSRKNFTSYRE